MTTARPHRLAALLAFLALVAGGCSAGAEGTVPDAHLTVGLPLEPPTLDHTASAAPSIADVLLHNVVETLLEIGPDGALRPGLAERWSWSEADRTYTFHLADATFHDGTPLTAEDVVHSLRLAMDPGNLHPFTYSFRYVASVDAVDRRTVVVQMTQHSGRWLADLARAPGMVHAARHADTLATGPVGTGPFRVVRWVRGDRLELERVEGGRGRPAIARVTFRFLPEPEAQAAAMAAGDVDILARVEEPDVLDGIGDGSAVLAGASTGKVMLSVNGFTEALHDVRVRRAISHAVDAAAVRAASWRGLGTPIGSHSTPADPWHVDLAGTYPHDPARARALLTEAGHADGLALALRLPPPTYARRAGALVAEQLGAVGVSVTVEHLDWTTWVDEVLIGGDYDLTVVSHAEPDDIAEYGNSSYYWHYDEMEVATQLADADLTADPDERDRIHAEVLERLAEDAVGTWLYAMPEVAVVRDGVSGYVPDRRAGAVDVRAVVVATPR